MTNPIQDQINKAKAEHPTEYQEWLDNCQELNQVIKEIDEGKGNQADLKQKQTTLESSIAIIELAIGFRDSDDDRELFNALGDLFK